MKNNKEMIKEKIEMLEELNKLSELSGKEPIVFEAHISGGYVASAQGFERPMTRQQAKQRLAELKATRPAIFFAENDPDKVTYVK